MSQFQWLKDYQEIETKVSVLELSLERSKKELIRWTGGDLANVKLEAESNASKLEERIEATEFELANLMNDLYDIKKLVSTFDGLEHKILLKKYIEGKTLEHTAIDLGYSHNYIKHKHAEVMRILRYVEKVSL